MNDPETLDDTGKLELRIQELECTLKSLLYTLELRDNSNPFKLKKTPLYE